MTSPQWTTPKLSIRPRTAGRLSTTRRSAIWKHETPERLRWGFVVEPKHLNRAGNLHGGMLMTFADQSMAMTARQATKVRRHATIELNTQFIGSVQLGQFVEAHAEVVRATRSVVFMEVKMFVDGRIVVSANGVWKILEE